MFKIKELGSSVKTETIAGITTFMTMAYILAVNPFILSKTGMNPGAVFTATVISAVIGTLIMALYANLPIACAPGMGANAFFAFTIVLSMGHSWQFAITAVLFEGIIFIILTICKAREAIVNAIPESMRHAITVGIGLFVAFIGLFTSGVIVKGGAIITLGNFASPSVVLTMVGVVVTAVLLSKNIKGALLLSILIITAIGVFFGVTKLPVDNTYLSLPPSLAPIFCKFIWHEVLSVDMLITVIVLLFMELFDTIGTLLACVNRAKLYEPGTKKPKSINKALLADAVATTAGACLGTSTVTAFVESTAGVAVGGKTGFTSLTVSILFLIALVFSPIFLMVPAAATAPILITVGLFMIAPIKEINLDDFTEAVPFFITIIMVPLTYSIADGILIGLIIYVLIKICTFKFRDLNWVLVIMAILFALKFALIH
ncbi:MAG: guanine permease [Lentisphaerae bacterium GWF2_38_69]|nr:MAG: guanine permease [Lentisphaerae bacterium GWF2_38_69]